MTDRTLLRRAIDAGAEGNASEFARQLGVPQSTVWRWQQATALPQPLRRLCQLIVRDPGAWWALVNDS